MVDTPTALHAAAWQLARPSSRQHCWLLAAASAWAHTLCNTRAAQWRIVSGTLGTHAPPLLPHGASARACCHAYMPWPCMQARVRRVCSSCMCVFTAFKTRNVWNARTFCATLMCARRRARARRARLHPQHKRVTQGVCCVGQCQSTSNTAGGCMQRTVAQPTTKSSKCACTHTQRRRSPRAHFLPHLSMQILCDFADPPAHSSISSHLLPRMPSNRHSIGRQDQFGLKNRPNSAVGTTRAHPGTWRWRVHCSCWPWWPARR